MADVLNNAGTGAKIGTVLGGPMGAAIGAGVGGGASLLGNYFAGESADQAAEQAKQQYAEQAQHGINTLQHGLEQNTQNFQPFVQAGQAGATGTLNSIQNRVQADQPTLSNTSPADIEKYLNPSAAYSTRSSNDAIRASALASGAAGGGMLKALSDNANKMAMTNYNNAYQQMLDTNNQNFVQGQQIYSNKTNYDQSQIGNYQNLMNTGAGAAGTEGNINLGYGNSLNQAYENLGNSNAGGTMTQGNVRSSVLQNAGNTVGNMAQQSSPLVGQILSSL